MTAAPKFSVVPGSERKAVPGAHLIRRSDPDQVVEVSVRMRPKNEAKFNQLRAELEKPGYKPIARAELERLYGADTADIEQIKKFAREYGLKVQEDGTEQARRTVKLSGTVAQLEKAFHVQLNEYSHPSGNFRGREGAISVPEEYASLITGVFGLDTRRQAEAHFRVRRKNGKRKHKTSASDSAFDPNQVAEIYDYPTPQNGANQSIGIIELGGGFQLDDIADYFSSLGITPAPQVISVSVDGGTNSPTTPDSADGEVMLDIEVAGAIAPAAKIVVYFTSNTDQGFLDAITTAVHDTTNNPSILSISWGGPESSWTSQAMTNMDQAFQAAAAVGITVCVAAGDNGSSDGVNDGSNHVDFPASDPFVLACGGTSLQASGDTITSETVWNDGASGGATGGGVSDVFPLPSWQEGFKVPAPTVSGGGRGVPDVSGDADPETGYNILVDGEDEVVGGTSAVAPLWAALIARINQQLGKSVGFLNPQIYSQAVESEAFHDITQGNNGAFQAAVGWDACTGLGSPNGVGLLDALSGTSSGSGTAQGRAARSSARLMKMRKPA
jgi:kumamolisin